MLRDDDLVGDALPSAESIGAFEAREASRSFTYNYGESVDANAFSTAIWIGDSGLGTALFGVSNVQPTTVRLTN